MIDVEEIIERRGKEWHWLQGEPSILALTKATNDCLDYFERAGENASILGVHRLIQESVDFLDKWRTHVFDGCDLCLAESELEGNIVKLQELLKL